MITNEEAIKYLIRPFATSTGSYNEYLKQKEAYDLAVKALEERSKEKPQAEWRNISPYDDKGECSLCCYLSKKYYNFCPNCGVEMKGGKE